MEEAVIKTHVRKVTQFFGVDRAVGFTLLGRGWGLAANLVNLWLIARCLTKDEQGFYYTFASILAMQILFDLGFNFVILQFTSHEMAKLKLGPGRLIKGNKKAKARMASLLWFSVKWYGMVAILVALIVVPAGLYFFTSNYKSGAEIVWQMPWSFLGVVTAGLLAISPLTAIVEGTGQVAEIALMRTCQSVLASLALWLALSSGSKLYSAPIFTTVNFLCALIWLFVRYGDFFKDLLSSRHEDYVISWWDEIWPFQWKLAVSFLSGYFIGQLFNPILFAFQGPAVAGQMGMSLSVAGGITGIGLAWINTKAAPFGRMIANKDYDLLRQYFFSLSLAIAGDCDGRSNSSFWYFYLFKTNG